MTDYTIVRPIQPGGGGSGSGTSVAKSLGRRPNNMILGNRQRTPSSVLLLFHLGLKVGLGRMSLWVGTTKSATAVLVLEAPLLQPLATVAVWEMKARRIRVSSSSCKVNSSGVV